MLFIIIEFLLITKQIDLAESKKFVAATLNRNNEIFMVNVMTLSLDSYIHPFFIAQLVFFLLIILL